MSLDVLWKLYAFACPPLLIYILATCEDMSYFESYLAISDNTLHVILQVESIVLSIISMLSSPNDESPANVEAAVSLIIILCYTLIVLLKPTCCMVLICIQEKKMQTRLCHNIQNFFVMDC